jgi:type I restriction enzyme S subunit
MKDEPKTLTPKLRFPEFRNKSGWLEKPLGEVVAPVVREREKPTNAYTGLGVRSHGKGTFRKEFEQPDKISMDQLYEVQPDELIANITFAW